MLPILYLVMLMATIVHSKKRDKEKFVKHMSEVSKFSCTHPQPRVIPLRDFGLTNPSMTYIPSATVLHRCDNDVGSCLNRENSCQSTKEDQLYLEFYENARIIKVTAVNHTECGCNSMFPKSNDSKKTIKLSEHNQLVEKFAYQTPLPRLVQLEDLNLKGYDITYYPSAAVMKQCIFDINYCKLNSNNRYCKCVKEENVTLYFKRHELNNTFHIINVTEKQHKSCSCVEQLGPKQKDDNLSNKSQFDSKDNNIPNETPLHSRSNHNRAQFKTNNIFLLFLELCFIIVFLHWNS